MPRWILPASIALMIIAAVPLAMITRARTSNSPTPRINLVPDMDYQPKYRPQSANALFADGRAMRPQMEGTIARDELQSDERIFKGIENGDWVKRIPIPVTESLMARGRERFDIYCAVCHGLTGEGDGLVHVRAQRLMEQGYANWVPPTDIHTETVVERPDGHLFNTITYGIRNMPAYGTQIATEDRWAIVAYVRALQRSQNATIDDVPDDVRPTLK